MQRQTASYMLLTTERYEDCYLPLLLPGAVALIIHLSAHTHENVNRLASLTETQADASYGQHVPTQAQQTPCIAYNKNMRTGNFALHRIR